MGNEQKKVQAQTVVPQFRKISFKYIAPIRYQTQQFQGDWDDISDQHKQQIQQWKTKTLHKSTIKTINDITQPENLELKTANRQAQQLSGAEQIDSSKLQIINKDAEKIINQVRVKWNSFIKMKKRNYLEDYAMLAQLGRGGYGFVYKAYMKYTGLYRAAKKIKKSSMNKDEQQKLFAEMAIMTSLDHPNIIKLYQAFDCHSTYVLILELCDGGQLYKRVVNRSIKEKEAARIIKQIIRALMYLHSKGIVHRDLKPENMLFEKDTDLIKIIDFGIACKKKPGEKLTSRLGTPYYIAPQVILKSYDEKCDLWSCGVILFMIITTYPPFRGETQDQVLESILREPVVLKGNVWNKVSNQCKDFLTKLLVKNPNERPSAEEAFNHPWLAQVEQYNSKQVAAPKTINKKESTKKQDPNKAVYSKINTFHFKNKLQAVVHTYVVSQLLSSSQRISLLAIFKEMDINGDGVISAEQLLSVLKTRLNTQTDIKKIERLVNIIDTNGSGRIDYTQFLVAGLDTSKITKKHLQKAFAYFDIDHNGSITFDEVTQFLENGIQTADSIKKMFDLVDKNGDGNISKEQFVSLLTEQFEVSD